MPTADDVLQSILGGEGLLKSEADPELLIVLTFQGFVNLQAVRCVGSGCVFVCVWVLVAHAVGWRKKRPTGLSRPPPLPFVAA